MNWGKGLIIVLGMMQLALVAQARDIESFTDSQGTLHISNTGSKQQGSPATPPSPVATPPPGSFPGKAPIASPAREAAPQAQAPVSKPGAAPAGTPAVPLQRVSYSPSQPVMPSSDGKIVIRRDRQGVIHITNVGSDEAPLMAPATPAPPVQKQARPPAAILPAVHTVSCPELGPEVAAYLEAKLLSHSPAWVGKTVHRYRDSQGVWQIVNAPAPDLPEAPIMAAAGALAAPAAAHDPPVTPTSPAMAWGPELVRPPSGSAPMVVAQRDRRGVVHIFTHAAAEVRSDRNSPVNFLGRVSPALQSCIVEAAELYQLPVPLVLALIRQESNFAHQAVSPKGAMGLMQLMPGTAASLGVRDPFDPRENILAGCRYFRQLLDYFQGNVPLALAGYNAGYNRVISAGHQVPAIKETQEFVTQVMGLYCLLEKHASGL